MAARNTRKRAAPGTSPPVDQVDFNIPASSDQYLWNPKTSDPAYSDADLFASNMYSALANQNLNADSTSTNQLARRSMQNTVSRTPFGNGSDNWSGVMEGSPQAADFNWFAGSDEDKVDAEAREVKEAATKARKSIPPFVMKLRSFLDGSKNTDLIRWSNAGDSFIVLDEEEFARTLIPELFKHSNYASFVRQLNMYGFHKQVGLSDNSMRASERKNKSPSEYKNPYFRRGKPDWMWLIQKPKPAGRVKGGRGKNDDGNEEEEGFEGDVPSTTNPTFDEKSAARGSRPPLLISQGLPSGPLAKEELADVHREIKLVRQQNLAIANIIAKMKRDQDQLTAQAKAFQEQHSRHENSINAILTFLATVYNRSLEGHQGQDIGAMFAGAMPQTFPQHGTVVDVGDLPDQDLNSRASPGGRVKRQPLLLKAPPSSDTAGLTSGASTGSHRATAPTLRRSSTNSRTNSTNQGGRADNPTGGFVMPEDGDVLSWINAANSNDASTPTSQMDFGEALSHLQNRNGKGPLSTSERNGMLEMMSNGNGSNAATPRPSESTNAISNSKTPVIDPQKMANISDDMDVVNRTLRNSQQSLDNIISRLSPMSPGGPDFSGSEYVPPPDQGLDFDSMFNADDYLNNPNDFGPLPDDFGDSNFNFDDALNTTQFDSTKDGGRIESLHGSEATTPAQTIEEDEPLTSPRKRQRRD